ncbi:hypothetical protein TEA_014827 [Camellia sinensis var. sinensis]|uniref:Uncharacterized protein n=1 Tax=Camellia sinensis var. sinensis TaxID=542762 RepID=A0A4S4DW76_CAMSN|nr:hypothetical protein TEA_014827 [Camellia sinensis var. sinensis]
MVDFQFLPLNLQDLKLESQLKPSPDLLSPSSLLHAGVAVTTTTSTPTLPLLARSAASPYRPPRIWLLGCLVLLTHFVIVTYDLFSACSTVICWPLLAVRVQALGPRDVESLKTFVLEEAEKAATKAQLESEKEL